jgi:hypothetical protein
MDWIEQLLGLNPDGGDGTVEMLIAGVLLAAALALVVPRVPAVRRLLARVVRARARVE